LDNLGVNENESLRVRLCKEGGKAGVGIDEGMGVEGERGYVFCYLFNVF
jgi:hypothetical protein